MCAVVKEYKRALVFIRFFRVIQSRKCDFDNFVGNRSTKIVKITFTSVNCALLNSLNIRTSVRTDYRS